MGDTGSGKSSAGSRPHELDLAFRVHAGGLPAHLPVRSNGLGVTGDRNPPESGV